MQKDTIYLKGDQSVEVAKRDVTIGDLVSMECTNQTVLAKVKAMRVMKIPERGKHRAVISVLKIIECIHQSYPSVDIQNLGAVDLIVTYEEKKKKIQIFHVAKIIGVAAITFIGAAFSIMAFNNDVDISRLFAQIYQFFMGKPKKGFSILELTYCVGLIAGILLFFNHFGGKRFTVDPTPMEVEMRLYENDIQTTLVQNYARKGQELDVDDADCAGNHRS